MPTPNRREALAAAALAAAHSGLTSHARAANPDSPIKDENDKPGTTDWQLTYVKFDAKAKYRQSLIEGYCTRTQRRGRREDRLLRQHRPRRRAFTIDLYRLGYYGGTGGRHMTALGPFDGQAAADARRSARSGSASAVGAVRHASRSRRTGPAASTSASSRPRSTATRATASSSSATTARRTSCSSAAQHLAGVQQVARQLLALRQRPPGQEAARLRRAGQLRPAVREVPAGHRQPAVTRLGRVPAVGVPVRVLAGAARLRRDVLLQRGRPQLARNGHAVQGVPVGRARRVLEPQAVRPLHGGGEARA